MFLQHIRSCTVPQVKVCVNRAQLLEGLARSYAQKLTLHIKISSLKSDPSTKHKALFSTYHQHTQPQLEHVCSVMRSQSGAQPTVQVSILNGVTLSRGSGIAKEPTRARGDLQPQFIR